MEPRNQKGNEEFGASGHLTALRALAGSGGAEFSMHRARRMVSSVAGALTGILLLSPLPKCCDLGFHASLARTFRTYLSAEYNLETSRHEGLDAIESAVDSLDSRSDKHTVMDMCNQVFCPPLKFEFQPHMGDEVGLAGAVLEAMSLLSSVKTKYL